jgi:hypothetical protein
MRYYVNNLNIVEVKQILATLQQEDRFVDEDDINEYKKRANLRPLRFGKRELRPLRFG